MNSIIFARRVANTHLKKNLLHSSDQIADHLFRWMKCPQSNPSILSEAIGGVLISTFIGIALSLIGIVLVIIAITACRYRSAWMFWFLCIYGGLMSFSHFFPFGLFFFIYALVKKDEFLKPQLQVLPPSCSLES